MPRFSRLLLAVSLAFVAPPSVQSAPVSAIPASDFLDSIGVNSGINGRGETLEKTIECAKYLGIRWFRSGIEGDPSLTQLIELHQKTGAKFSWSPGSGGANLEKLLTTARTLAAAGALLSFEGPNEPNNWKVTFDGTTGGGNLSWMPVAKLQAELYKSVKSDLILKKYPVWSISEGGAETDNVGLQFLTIPKGAATILPAGTKYADCANVHNYLYHPNAPGLADNKTWDAADPSPACKVDGLFGEYGTTWGRHFPGYSEADLRTLPRVTTETGCTIDGPVTEEIHARNLLTLYLDQFARGWNHTAVYLLRDRVDEGGNQKFGFYRPDDSPRPAAIYLHNLTTVLADKNVKSPVTLDYSIAPKPVTVHDLLLQKSDGTLALIVWNEQISGSADVTIRLGRAFASPRVFDPTVGVEPVQTLRSTRSLSLTLSDHPLVILLK